MLIGLLYLLIGNFAGNAFTPIFVKLGTQDITPIVFTFYRFVCASVLFFPIYFFKRQSITKNDLKLLTIQAIFLGINSGMYAIGIQYTSITISQILYTLVPIITGLLSWIFLKEKFTKEKIIGGIIAFSGVIFLLSKSFENSQDMIYGKPIGNFLILIAVISWSIYIILAKKLSKKFHAFTISFYGFLITAFFLFLISCVEYLISPNLEVDFTTTSTISIIGVGIISIVLIVFIQMGTKRTTAFTSSLFLYLGPFFSSMTAVPFFHEKITPNLVLGGILILFGVFYATAYKEVVRSKKLVIQYFYEKNTRK